MQRLVFWCITVAFSVPNPVYATVPPVDRLPELIEHLERLSNTAQSDLDVNGVVERAEFEAENLIEFVRKKVRYQPYSGVLRGAEGTLISGAGNAHDQALTLATLLKTAGFDAQILQGELSESQARTLLDEVGRIPPPQNVAPELPAFVGDEVVDVFRANSSSLDTIRHEVRMLAEPLLRKASQSGALVAPQQFELSLIEEARNYRWVRYRSGPTTTWQEVHPAFIDMPADWNVAWKAVENDTIDENALHRVSVQLFMSLDGGKHADPIALTDPWRLTVANLIGRPLQIDFLSDAAVAEFDRNRPELAMETSHLFFAMFNGEVPEGLKAFDLSGRTYSASSLEGLSSIFDTLGRKMDKASATLEGIGTASSTEEPSMSVQSVWIEFTIRPPGDEQKKIRRDVLTFNPERSELETKLQLHQRWTVDITGASATGSYFIKEISTEAVEILKGFEQFRDYAVDNPDASDTLLLKAYAHYFPSPNRAKILELRQLFSLFESESGPESYAHLPQILSIRRGYSMQDSALSIYEMVDIVANSRRSIGAGSPFRQDFATSMARGVWETRMEGHGQMRESGERRNSAYKALQPAADWSLKPAAGALNLAPHSDADGEAWWQIDPATGSAVGMLRTVVGPAGAVLTERQVIGLVGLVLGLIMAGLSTYACFSRPNTSAACCIGMGAAGFGISVVVALIAAHLMMTYGVVAATAAATTVTAAEGAAVGLVASIYSDVFTLVLLNCD